MLPWGPRENKDQSSGGQETRQVQLEFRKVAALLVYLVFLILTFFFFLGPHTWNMEVPRLGVKSELQLLAYTTATAARDLSHVCCRWGNFLLGYSTGKPNL